MSFALGVEVGTIVHARGRRRANVYVAAGQVAAVMGELLAAAEQVDAGGLLVLPGMIDGAGA
jgi:dihydroorotase-like cyclic amidohydrolase